MDIIGLASRIPTMIFGAKSDDDFSDRLNYRYTVALLIFFSIILTTRQYGSEVIKCWVPAHFTSNYEQYVSQICWITNTYSVDTHSNIPKTEVERRQNEIKYYQWVSFVLLFQALLFYMPRIFWRTVSIKAGLNICDLVEAAHNYKSADNFERRKNFMNYLVKNIDQYVDDDRRYESSRNKNRFVRALMTLLPCFGRFLGNYIVILYFVVKFLYIANTCLQIFLISAFLGQDYWRFGYDIIEKIWHGRGEAFLNSKYFPKVTLCDFMIREVGNPNKSHKYTVQCVLPINLFNQQIFTAIWFWYMLVLGWNIAEFVIWVQRSIPGKANKWISKRVYLINQSIKVKQNRLKHFLEIYLEQDGIFMIRMIANNTSDYVATDLIHHLWCQHAENYDKLFPKDPHNIPDIECPFDHKKIDTHKTSDPPKPHHHHNNHSDHEDFEKYDSNHGTLRKFPHENNKDNYLSFRKVYNHNYRYMNQMSRDSEQHLSNDLIAPSYDFPPASLNKRSIHFKEDDEINNNNNNQEKIDNINAIDENSKLLSFASKKKDSQTSPGTNV